MANLTIHFSHRRIPKWIASLSLSLTQSKYPHKMYPIHLGIHVNVWSRIDKLRKADKINLIENENTHEG